MSKLHRMPWGDDILDELAGKAGAHGLYEVREVWQETHENTGEDGEFALETWLHFVVGSAVDSGEGQEEHYYLPGTLQQNILDAVYGTMRTPFYYR